MAGDEMGVSVDDSASSTENVNPLKPCWSATRCNWRVSPLIQAVLDIIAWTIGITLALYIRLDFNPLPIERDGLPSSW
ncbi:MAG: hypothetical protein R2735_14630 [Microthrixaceae bacterium]